MKRLGLYLGRLPGFDKAGLDRRELIECVRAADACGYDSFWMPEAWEREAFTILTDLAVHTERIHLCTGIVNVFSRSPALIAMSAATLDEISGGRFRLGLGTSGPRVIQDFHGVTFDKPLTRLKESIRIIRALLAGEAVDFSGECFELRRFSLGSRRCEPISRFTLRRLRRRVFARWARLPTDGCRHIGLARGSKKESPKSARPPKQQGATRVESTSRPS